MRIIGGKHKGRRLVGFDGTDVRPTSDRAREALFNILSPRVAGSTFYDAFCGSGAVAIEAISRGAANVTMTDVSPSSIALAKKNLALINEPATVKRISATAFLERTSLLFDIIFLDPPYDSDEGYAALEIISKRKLLRDGGVAVYERRAKKNDDNRVIDGLIMFDKRVYGIAEFDFYGAKND